MKTLLFACGAALLSYSASAQQLPAIDTTDTEKLDEVLVKAVRVTAESPITYSNLSEKEIEERNLGQDLPILLSYLPNVIATSDAGAGVGYTGFRVRGTGNQGINVTINGIPYNDSESLGTFFVNLQDFSSSVESLQLQRGVGTSTNGGAAFGASLNILTDAVEQDAFAEVSASGGSFNTRRANLKFGSGLLSDHFSVDGRFSIIKSDGYVDRATSDLKSYFFQGAYIDENTLIKAVGFGGFEETYQAWNGISINRLEGINGFEKDRTYNSAGQYTDDQGNTRFYDNEVDNYRQDHLQLLWNQRYGNNWSSNFALHYTYGRGYFEQYRQDASFENYGLEEITIEETTINTTDLVQRRWLDNDFYGTVFSVNYKDDKLDFTTGGAWNIYDGNHFGEIRWAEYASNSSLGERYYQGIGDKQDFNIYSKAIYKFNDWLSAYGDLQLRTISYEASGGDVPSPVDKQYTFFNPKAGFTAQLNENNNLYFSYGRANREPNRTDFENGSPEPEQLNDFELGWRFDTPKARFNINTYYMDYRNQLVFTGAVDNVGAPIRANSGSSYRLGAEFAAGVQLTENLAIYPNISLSTNKNRDFITEINGNLDNLGATDISYSPEVVAGNRLDFFPVTDFRITLLSKYVGEQALGNAGDFSYDLDSYFVNDLNLQYELKDVAFMKSILITGLVNNLFDVEYVNNGYDSYGPERSPENVLYFPQAGTNFLVGATISF